MSTLCSPHPRLVSASSGFPVIAIMAVMAVITMTSACSSEDSPVSPGGSSSNMITISATGANPQTLQIRLGERVLFVNNDSVNHDMSSDQHPSHLDCPAVNQVGFLAPGQSRETGNFVRAETCRFHDHINPANASLTGSIVITE